MKMKKTANLRALLAEMSLVRKFKFAALIVLLLSFTVLLFVKLPLWLFFSIGICIGGLYSFFLDVHLRSKGKSLIDRTISSTAENEEDRIHLEFYEDEIKLFLAVVWFAIICIVNMFLWPTILVFTLVLILQKKFDIKAPKQEK